MRLIYYTCKSFRRSEHLYHAWRIGLAKHGLDLPKRSEADRRGVEADVAIFYGLWGSLRDAVGEYRQAGAKAVFCDLGFWGRIEGGKLEGYHRIAVNGFHATEYFQRVRHPGDRFRRFGIRPIGFRARGDHALLVGMSAKAAWVYGLGPEEWERATAKTLLAAARRPVDYRPKQTWEDAQPIEGTRWRGRTESIDSMIRGSWAVVTHHSHAAIEALTLGVPVFCEQGLASVLAERDYTKIETPRMPSAEERDQLLFDAAYTQWKVNEIAEGHAWRYLLEEGLV